MSSPDRRLSVAVCAMVLLGLLLLALAWGLGQVIEEARTYALVHGTSADTGPDQTTQTVLVLCAGGLLVAAVTVRALLGARRRPK